MENLTIEEYMKKVYDEYIENAKIYAEAVVLINRKLIDISPEQWLDLKYCDHRTMDPYVKRSLIATWLIRSYKWQFDEYLAIKQERDVYERDCDIEYDPSDKDFVEWLASKFCNHLEMDWYTKNALWVYWMRGDDEELFTDDEDSIPKEHDNNNEVEAFNESNYLLNIDIDLFTYDVSGFEVLNNDEWMDWCNQYIS
ncbi:hypothetical protein Tco_0530233 [Tanacetum coccineum]